MPANVKRSSVNKPLNYKNVDELNKVAENIKIIINNQAQCKQYCKSANEVFRKAESHYKNGEEENAYILYMRYFYIYDKIRKSFEFNKDKKIYLLILKECDTEAGMERAEDLSQCLKKRYMNLVKAEGASKKKASNNLNEEVDLILPDVPSDLKVKQFDIVKEKENTTKDQEDKREVSLRSINTVKEKSSCKFISVYDLYEILKDSKSHPHSTLIIDVRPVDEYNEASISHQCMINVPENLLKSGANVNTIEMKLSKEAWELWSSRFEKQNVIIIDYNFNENSISIPCPVTILADILLKFEGNFKLFALLGGFKQWHLSYPSLTTNPVYIKAVQNLHIDQDPLSLIKDLSYPVLPVNVSKMKEETITSTSIANVNVTPPGEKQNRKSENTTTSKDDYFAVPIVKQMIANQKLSNGGVLQNSMSEVTPVNLKSEQTKLELIEERIPSAKNTSSLNLSTEQNEKPSSVKPNNGSLSEVSSTYNVPKESSDSSNVISNQPQNPSVINSNDKANDVSKIVVSSLSKLTTVLPASGSSIKLDKPAGISVVSQVSPMPNVLTNKLPPTSSLTQFNISTTHSPTIKPQVPLQLQSNYQVQVPSHSVEQQTPVSFISSPATSNESKNTSEITPVNNLTTSLSTQNINFPYLATKSTGSTQASLNSSKPPINSQDSKMPDAKLSVIPNTSLSSTNGFPFETQKPKKPFTTPFGLPNGWEKAISHTGRIYYKDHNTATTHWDLPLEIQHQLSTKVSPKNEPEVGIKPLTEPLTAPLTAPLAAPKISLKNDAESKMKRSLSSPNLNESGADQLLKKPLPVIDRSSKPIESTPVLVDRSTKPVSASRLEKLAPVYGSKGRILTGLKNLGNTCYMNSVIQCLANTLPLGKYFTSGMYEKHLNLCNTNAHPGELARELAFLIIVISAGEYRSVSPIDFKIALGKFAPDFNGYNQQDAHELLMFFMDGLHEDVNKVAKKEITKAKDTENFSDEVAADIAWKDYKLNNDSVIVDLFQGQFLSTVTCLSCNKRSKTFDAFNCLQLQLPSNQSTTLESCIKSFTKAEKIGGNDSWKCSNCRRYREASKTIEIWKLPPVLIIQLKRFHFDGRWHNKIQTTVNFPMQNFDMSKYVVAPQSKFTKYRLYAVINHYGSFESGHYTASCENPYYGKWYQFDDSIIKDIDESSIKTNAAYLLFYTAVDFKEYIKS